MPGLYRATIHLTKRSECALDRLVAGLESPLSMSVEAVSEDDVTVVVRAGEHADRLRKRLDDDEDVSFVERVGRSGLRVTKRPCGTHAAIYDNRGVLTRDCLLSPSRRVYHVLFSRRDDFVEIIAGLRDVGTVSVDGLAPVDGGGVDLTDRQRAVVTRAFEAGYYEWPRDVKSEALAAELDISRATLHEHLRKAERKLIGNALETDDGALDADEGSLNVDEHPPDPDARSLDTDGGPAVARTGDDATASRR